MIPDELMLHYLERTVGRLYKILPMKEDGEPTIHEYIDGLLSELIGIELLEKLSDQPYYVGILGVVSYLSEHIDSCSTKKVKRDVFRAIELCKKLQNFYRR